MPGCRYCTGRNSRSSDQYCTVYQLINLLSVGIYVDNLCRVTYSFSLNNYVRILCSHWLGHWIRPWGNRVLSNVDLLGDLLPFFWGFLCVQCLYSECIICIFQWEFSSCWLKYLMDHILVPTECLNGFSLILLFWMDFSLILLMSYGIFNN